ETLVQVQSRTVCRAVRASRCPAGAVHGTRPVGQPGTAQHLARLRTAGADRRVLPADMGATAEETPAGVAARVDQAAACRQEEERQGRSSRMRSGFRVGRLIAWLAAVFVYAGCTLPVGGES